MKKEVKEKIDYLKGTRKPYMIVIRDDEVVNCDDYFERFMNEGEI